MFSEGISIASIKTFGYVAVTSVLVYTNIQQEAFYILSALMIIDTITGVAKQHAILANGITSRRLSNGVMAKFVTLLFLLSGGIVVKYFTESTGLYVQTVMSLLIMSEFYSIIQNVYAVRTGILLPEYDAISITLKKITGLIREYIDKLTSLPKKK